jgi:hypothetical protein
MAADITHSSGGVHDSFFELEAIQCSESATSWTLAQKTFGNTYQSRKEAFKAFTMKRPGGNFRIESMGKIEEYE